MRRLLGYLDKVALVLALLALLAAGAWTAFVEFPKLDAVAERNPAIGIAATPHETQIAQMPTIAQVSWPDPPAQSRGRDWLYDVFTPPVIYVNPQTNEFTVTPPAAPHRVDAPVDTPFEVELVRVRQEQYRIQLVGYLGNAGAYVAQFELVETGAVVPAREGATLEGDKGAFTVRAFEVRRETTQMANSMPVTEPLGVAVILDKLTGREVTLTTRERYMLNRYQCVLRETFGERKQHVLREGGSATVNGFEYVIMGLSLNPQQAIVTRRAPKDLLSETRTLTPLPDAAEGSGVPPSGAARHNTIDLQRPNLFPSQRGLTPLDQSRLLTQYP